MTSWVYTILIAGLIGLAALMLYHRFVSRRADTSIHHHPGDKSLPTGGNSLSMDASHRARSKGQLASTSTPTAPPAAPLLRVELIETQPIHKEEAAYFDELQEAAAGLAKLMRSASAIPSTETPLKEWDKQGDVPANPVASALLPSDEQVVENEHASTDEAVEEPAVFDAKEQDDAAEEAALPLVSTEPLEVVESDSLPIAGTSRQEDRDGSMVPRLMLTPEEVLASLDALQRESHESAPPMLLGEVSTVTAQLVGSDEAIVATETPKFIETKAHHRFAMGVPPVHVKAAANAASVVRSSKVVMEKAQPQLISDTKLSSDSEDSVKVGDGEAEERASTSDESPASLASAPQESHLEAASDEVIVEITQGGDSLVVPDEGVPVATQESDVMTVPEEVPMGEEVTILAEEPDAFEILGEEVWAQLDSIDLGLDALETLVISIESALADLEAPSRQSVPEGSEEAADGHSIAVAA